MSTKTTQEWIASHGMRLIPGQSRRSQWRTPFVVAAIGFFATVPVLPAGAGVTGPCEGTATIDGVVYDASFDTADNPIVVPAKRAGLRIPYSGSIGVQNTNYLGAVGVVVGVFVTVAVGVGVLVVVGVAV